jgi:uncharacterized protein YdaU (DUF1376 family)
MALRPDGRYPRVRATKSLYIQYCPEKLRTAGLKVDRDADYAYRCIMDMIFITGDRLRDDDRILAEVTRSTMSKWRKCRAVLLDWGLIRIEDGRITSDDAQERLDKLEVQISQKSVAGKASGSVRSSGRKPLENNETAPTAVERPFNGCSPAVGTKEEGRKEEEDDDATRARMRLGDRLRTMAVDVAGPPPMPAGTDPNQWALVQAMTDAVVGAYGEEIGGYNRHMVPSTDRLDAAALLKTGTDLGLEVGEVVDEVRDHLARKCRARAADGLDCPVALSLFVRSAADALMRRAKRKAQADRGFVPEGFDPKRSGNGRPTFTNGGDAPTSSALRQPWQETQKRLVGAKRIDAARQLSAAAAQGNEAANRLAAELEGLHFAKKTAAAARAA